MCLTLLGLPQASAASVALALLGAPLAALGAQVPELAKEALVAAWSSFLAVGMPMRPKRCAR